MSGMGVNLMGGPGEETFAQGFGSSPEGEFIAEVGTKAFEYLKNNPAEAVALGVTAIPGVGLAFKLGKGAFNIGKFLVGQGAKFVRNRPFTSAVIGGTGAFTGQDAINEMVQNFPETMEDVGGYKSIPNVLS